MKPLLEGNRIQLLESGSEFFPALKACIAAAQREIYLETYIFCDDATGRDIAEALVQAAQRGVVVRLLVDGFGSRRFVESGLLSLRQEGVHVQVYRREIKLLSLRRHRLRRLHRKLAVIDGATAFVGGINIVDDFDADAPPVPRLDYAVKVEGPLLRSIHRTVRRMWWLVSWARLGRRQSLPKWRGEDGRSVGDVRAAFLLRDNLRHRRGIEEVYLEVLAKAQNEVLIANAYFFPGRRFRHALRDAAARGVNVVLLLQGVSDHPTMLYATRALYPVLLSYGVRLFEYRRSELHAKVAVVDRRWATVGSSNIDPFSLLMAREANVVVDDAGFATRLHTSLEQAMASGAVELRHEDWHRQPSLRRLASWLAFQFVRLTTELTGGRYPV